MRFKYHRTIKVRHSDVELSSSIYLDAQNGYKDPKFKVKSLFGAIKLNRKVDSNNHFYAGYCALYLFHCLLLLDLIKI